MQGKDGARLGLAEASPHEIIPAGSNAVVTITVDDLDTTRQNYQTAGVKLIGDVIEIPHHVRMQSFQDMDGNTFQICQLLS